MGPAFQSENTRGLMGAKVIVRRAISCEPSLGISNQLITVRFGAQYSSTSVSLIHARIEQEVN